MLRAIAARKNGALLALMILAIPTSSWAIPRPEHREIKLALNDPAEVFSTKRRTLASDLQDTDEDPLAERKRRTHDQVIIALAVGAGVVFAIWFAGEIIKAGLRNQTSEPGRGFPFH